MGNLDSFYHNTLEKKIQDGEKRPSKKHLLFTVLWQSWKPYKEHLPVLDFTEIHGPKPVVVSMVPISCKGYLPASEVR